MTAPEDETLARTLYELIGRGAAAHARLDHEARELFVTLVGKQTAGAALAWRGQLRQVVADCQAMIGRAGLDSDAVEAAKPVFEAAIKADETRQRLVHDDWFVKPTPLGPELATNRWARHAEVAMEAQADLAGLSDMVHQIRRAWARMHALNGMVGTLLSTGFALHREDIIRSYRLVIDDRFSLDTAVIAPTATVDFPDPYGIWIGRMA